MTHSASTPDRLVASMNPVASATAAALADAAPVPSASRLTKMSSGLPGAPDPSHPLPGTRLRSKRRADDAEDLSEAGDPAPTLAPPADAGETPEADSLSGASQALADPSAASAASGTSADPNPSEDDDRDNGLALWALGGVAGIGGIALMAGGGKSSSQGGMPAGQPPGGQGPSAPPPATPDHPTQPDTGTSPPPVPPTVPDPTMPDPSGPTQPPVATPPRAGRLTVTLATDTGRSAVDSITADASFVLDVVDADPGTTVRYQHSLDGGLTWQDNTVLTAPWPDGDYLLRAVVSNGDVASVTASVALTLDTQAPATADLQVSGAPAQGQVHLAMSGAEAGASLSYEISLDQGRTWLRTKDSLPALQDGEYLFRGVVTDAAGNQSLTAVQSITVDTEAPAPMTLQVRKVGEQGWDALSTLSSTGAVDLKLTLPSGTTAVYQQSSDEGLTWSTVTSAVRGLTEGHYSFRALLTDAAGNETVLDPVPLTVDMTAVPAPQIHAVLRSGQGAETQDYISWDGYFQIVPDRVDATVEVLYEFRQEGSLTWLPTSPSVEGMLEGRYEFRVSFRDPAGNTSHSNTLVIDVDTREPGAGTITLADFSDVGISGTDRITSDNSFTLVHLLNGGVNTLQWQRSFNNGATWSNTTATQEDLLDGHYLFRAVVTDYFGHIFTTRSVSVTVDALTPARPVLALQDLEDTGAADQDVITQDGQFTLAALGASADAQTSFEVSFTGKGGWLKTSQQQDLPSGTYWFRATCQGEGGAVSASTAVKVVVDRDAPAAAPLQLTDFDDTGAFGDRVSSDTSFTLATPEREAGATVRFWRSTDGGTTWALTDATQQGLSDGQYWFRTEVTDLAGNTRLGPPRAVTVDTTAPQAGALTLTASGPDGVNLQWAGAETPDTLEYQVSWDQGQTWLPVSAQTLGLSAGDYLFRAVVSDAAGNGATTAPVAWHVDLQTGDIRLGHEAAPFSASRDADASPHARSATEALWVASQSGHAFVSDSLLLSPVAGV